MLNWCKVRSITRQSRCALPGSANLLNPRVQFARYTVQILALAIMAFLPSVALSQEESTSKSALEALGTINADIVELNRISDYQAELLALAEEDPAAAALARRGAQSCAQRALVKHLCGALLVSFPLEQTSEESR